MSAWMLRGALCFIATAAIAEQSPLPWAPGRWAVYRLRGASRGDAFLRVALVRESESEPRPPLWLEVELGNSPELVSPLARMRFPFRGGGPVEGTPVWVAAGLEEPIEVMMGKDNGKGRDGLESRNAAPRPSVGAAQRISTHAGAITATPVTWWANGAPVKRLWTSECLPFWKVARWELPSLGRSMEIWRFGEGAVSRFDSWKGQAPLSVVGAEAGQEVER